VTGRQMVIHRGTVRPSVGILPETVQGNLIREGMSTFKMKG
jgi:hypothetical protein